jgi:GINS complex subunit 4
MDDTTGGISMVDKPDEDRAVIVRCLRDVGEVAVEGWSAVRRWVMVGDVELI